MNVSSGQFMKFIAEEIKKNKGTMYPIKAGLLERMLVKNAGSQSPSQPGRRVL